jgi:hypothetical protein
MIIPNSPLINRRRFTNSKSFGFPKIGRQKRFTGFKFGSKSKNISNGRFMSFASRIKNYRIKNLKKLF